MKKDFKKMSTRELRKELHSYKNGLIITKISIFLNYLGNVKWTPEFVQILYAYLTENPSLITGTDSLVMGPATLVGFIVSISVYGKLNESKASIETLIDIRRKENTELNREKKFKRI